MSAFDTELVALRAAATITETRVVNGRTWFLGTLGGHDVVLLLSGFSMVNAAMTTQALLDRIPIRAIVFSGIAGGVNPGLDVGDVTVPAQWGNYQENVFARETPTGFAPSRVTTDFPGFGMMFTQGTSVTVPGAPADSLARRFWFPADTLALRIARGSRHPRPMIAMGSWGSAPASVGTGSVFMRRGAAAPRNAPRASGASAPAR